MYVEVTDSDTPDVMKRSGAAGLALECASRPHDGGTDLESGPVRVHDTAAEAIEAWLDDEGARWGSMPTRGYRVEREDGGRVFYSHDVDGRTKAAVLVGDAVRDADGRVGWGFEAWAVCDPSELAPEITEELGIEVWEDADGRRAPTYEISSRRGSDHCGWEDITFLSLGEQRGPAGFVRDVDGEFDGLRSTYDSDAELPDDAVDTGWRHDGRHLWLADDDSAAYLVALDDRSDVERWPAIGSPILCD